MECCVEIFYISLINVENMDRFFPVQCIKQKKREAQRFPNPIARRVRDPLVWLVGDEARQEAMWSGENSPLAFGRNVDDPQVNHGLVKQLIGNFSEGKRPGGVKSFRTQVAGIHVVENTVA